MTNSTKTILQIVPSLHSGGVERGVIDTAFELKKQNFNSIVASSGGAMVSQLEKLQIEHIKIDLRTKNPLKIYRNIKKIKEIIAKNKIDLIHLRSRAPMISAYFACKKNLDIKLVSTIHGPYSVNLGNNKVLSKVKIYYNSFMLRSDAIITVSSFIKEYVLENYQSLFEESLKNKITVIPRGVDTKTFDPSSISVSRTVHLAQKWNIPEDKKVILFPARITSWKGHEFLIESLKRVKNDYFCIFIGSDHGHECFSKKIKQRITEANLEDKVKFLDNQKDMALTYSVANIVISASIRPEAFGRVAIESQAMKKITIATNIGGSLETIISGKTGFLVKNRDVSDFAKKIDLALTLTNEDTKKIGQEARENILSNFTNQKMLDSTIEVYKNLLK